MSHRRRSCADPVAPVRAEPRASAEQVTQALAGEPLLVLEERGPWARIETAYAYPGWIRMEALGAHAECGWLAPRGATVLDEARSFLGAPYEWGGLTERGIDCSGLVHIAYRRVGRLVPRDADQQEEAGAAVDAAALRPGDLVTYGEGEGADHIAFWLGGGRILHATDRAGVHRVIEEEQLNLHAARLRRYVRI